MVGRRTPISANRSITGFSFDEAGDAVVHLDCGHRVHARHHPPWQERPFVTDESSRRRLIHTPYHCAYCDPDCDALSPPATLELVGLEVPGEWIDYNGHMNVAYYVMAFDKGVDALLARLGIDQRYVDARRASTFTAEIHVCYLREVYREDPLRICGRLLDFDDRRMHFLLEMHHASAGFLSATLEQVAIHIDLAGRRSAPFPPDVCDRLQDLKVRQRELPPPPQVGRVMGLRSTRPKA